MFHKSENAINDNYQLRIIKYTINKIVHNIYYLNIVLYEAKVLYNLYEYFNFGGSTITY